MSDDFNCLLAKSDGTLLFNHLIGVADKSKELSDLLEPTDKELSSCCFIAGLFHDLGKGLTNFQKHLKGENIEYLLHNKVSFDLFSNYILIDNDVTKDLILDTIIYHHPFNDKTNDVTLLSNNEKIIIINLIKKLIEFNNNNNTIKLKFNEHSDLFEIKSYNYIINDSNKDRNQKFIFINNILKFSDILLSNKELNIDNIINRKYKGFLELVKPLSYDDRFYVQQKIVNDLLKYKITMFESQTGFGKTMLGLLYLLNNNKKGYWVCPRNSICRGVYTTLCNEVKNLDIDKIISVGLLLGGEWVEGDENCDVIVTNIDNFVNPLFKTKSNLRTYNILHCNCVFDEFHEYLTDNALMAVYDLIIKTRKLTTNTKTLLLSATPIKLLYDNYIDDIKNGDEKLSAITYDCDSILNKEVEIIFNDNDINGDFKSKNYLISTNTVSKTQEIFLKNQVDNILHARYIESDKTERFEMLFKGHSKGVISDNTSWVANNVISTGVDVSFGNLILHWVTPEKLIQSGGRCNRWGECKDTPKWVICLNEKDRNEQKGLDTFYDVEIAIQFNKFLKTKIKQNEIVKLKLLYELRTEFYENNKEFTRFIIDCKKESYKNLSTLKYNYNNHTTTEKEIKRISNKPNLRENDLNSFNFFVLLKMAQSDLFLNESIQVDNQIIKFNNLSINSNLKSTLRLIKNNKKYFKNKKHFERLNENTPKLIEHLKKLAISSETPWVITNEYFYSNLIGLYREK